MLCHCAWFLAQNFNGKILDSENGRGIPLTKIDIVEWNVSVVSDEEGNFEIDQNGTESLLCKFSAVGYREVFTELKCCDSLVIRLSKDLHEIGEVRLHVGRNELGDNKTQRVSSIELERLGILNTLSITESLSQIEGVQMASYGPLNAKPVIRGLQGMRIVTLWDGMRIENQQWGSDHGLGISQTGISSVEVIKGPQSLLYQGDAVGGLIYLKEASFAPIHTIQTELNSQLESVSMGVSNSAIVKVSKKRLNINLAALYTSHADYSLPNGKFLSDSRMQDLGVKLNVGYRVNKVNLRLNYLYSNSIVGIPGHTHDTLVTPESFMTGEQNRNRSLPHQWIKNHFVNFKAIYFIHRKHKLALQANTGLNDLSEYEDKIFTPAINMLLLSNRTQVKHTWKLNQSSEILSGIQFGIQNNINGENALETILRNSMQQDFGMYTSFTKSIGDVKLHTVLRYDQRNILMEQQTLQYNNINVGIGLRKIWQTRENNRHDFSVNVSSGSRAPHTSELFSDGVHHGATRYELGDSSLSSEYIVQCDLDYYFSGEHFSFLFNPFFSRTFNFIQLAPRNYNVEEMPVYQYERIRQGWIYGLETQVHYHPHFFHALHFETGYSAAFGESSNGDYFHFFPQNRLQTTLRFDLSEFNLLGLNSLILRHQYFFEQNRVGNLESPSPSYHYLQVGATLSYDAKTPFTLSFGIRNILNTSYVNHLSRLKPLGLVEPGRSFYINLQWQSENRFKQ